MFKDEENGLVVHGKQGSFVVMIDPDKFNLDMAKTLLEKHLHCRVLTANNGIEGLELLKNHRVQLLLTELDMPYCNGFQVIDGVRADKKNANLPVVVFSQKATPEIIARLHQYAISDYIKKPFLPETFLARVQKYIRYSAVSTVLLVDDDEASLYKTESMLNEAFLQEVIAVSSGIEALEILRNEEIQLVITSVEMPLVNGLRLLKFVRMDKELHHIPVIFTGDEAEEDPDFFEEAEELVYQGFIQKPVTMTNLVAAVNAALT